ncbi:MAG TPA: alpha-L-rhamnosidase C-terminal domain-containing protein, partial [Candidatus Limiplasma sp.]|nr:alpha-L-rhamnosidase C-terminal domain-containing protein [Candidatus Limiplasma sp.]
YYALSTELVAKTARVLGLLEDAEAYEALYEQIVSAFRREYITATGRLASETQTACVLALYFQLAAPEHRARILQTLRTNIQKHNGHLVTGFVGTPYLCHTLSDNGLHELAGEIFLKEDFPSWLNCVNLGATTIWERWDSMKADGSFDESGMNSFNHYAYGAIGSWMMRTLAGLKPLKPGYRESLIRPMPIKGITGVTASLDTPYGPLRCAWRCRNRQMTVDITVPANTTAQIKLPDKEDTIVVGSGEYHYAYATTLELDKERYSRESTLGELMESPATKPYLEKVMPGMTDNTMIKLAYPMTITQMSANLPQGADAVFDSLIAELNRLEKEE